MRLPEAERNEVLRLAQFLPAPVPSFAEFGRVTSGFEPHPWQRDYLFPILEELATKRGVRYLVHGPPQFGKSMWAEERLPAYALGINPLWRVRTACYNITTATKFGGVNRQIMESDEYKKWFGERARVAKGGDESFYTKARFESASGQESFKALGLETGLVGSGPDLLIIGDPYSGPEQVYSLAYAAKLERFINQSLLPRVSADTNILILYHRWHGRDLASTAEGSRLGFKKVRFPALGDENEDGLDPTGRGIDEPLSELRSFEELNLWRETDPVTFYSLAQGTPMPQEGMMFRETDFDIVDEAPPLEHWYRGYDVASSVKETADYTVGALVGVDQDLTLYIKDIRRYRKEYPDARADIIETAQTDGESVPIGIEDKVAGLAMFQDLMRVKELLGYQLQRMPAKGDKKQRASGWAARARAGKLKLVRGAWNQAFINECLAFDGLGLAHDDQVDAVSIAFALIYTHRGGEADQEDIVEAGTHRYYQKLAAMQLGHEYDEDEDES